jgi:hypothetical protein
MGWHVRVLPAGPRIVAQGFLEVALEFQEHLGSLPRRRCPAALAQGPAGQARLGSALDIPLVAVDTDSAGGPHRHLLAATFRLRLGPWTLAASGPWLVSVSAGCLDARRQGLVVEVSGRPTAGLGMGLGAGGTDEHGGGDHGHGNGGQEQTARPGYGSSGRSAGALGRHLYASGACPQRPGTGTSGRRPATRPAAPDGRTARRLDGGVGRGPAPAERTGALGGVRPGEHEEPQGREGCQAGVPRKRQLVEQHAKHQVGRADADRPGGRVPPWPPYGQSCPPIDQDLQQVARSAVAIVLGARFVKRRHAELTGTLPAQARRSRWRGW